jgi:DNA-binding CsgD family transcriptional regulator
MSVSIAVKDPQTGALPTGDPHTGLPQGPRPAAIKEQPHARSVVVITGNPIGRLTERQREILRAFATEGSLVHAAERLCLQPNSVKNHLSVIYGRLLIDGHHDSKIGRAAYLLGLYDATHRKPPSRSIRDGDAGGDGRVRP